MTMTMTMTMLNKDDIIKLYGPNPDKWNWFEICFKTSALSEDFIRESQNKVHWLWISSNQSLSEDFIREFQDKVYWYWISKHQSLSEDFIREFKDKVLWTNISHYQTLSEDFIREFKDKVNWLWISSNQSLSENFIREFKDRTYIKYFIFRNTHCSPDFRIKYLKDNNYIKKQDPSTHDFEYFEQPKSIPNKDLQLLKELIC